MSALTDYFTSLANKIRTKTGKSDTLTPDDMVDEVDAVYAAGAASVPTPTSQSKSVNPTTSAQTIEPDSGYDYLSQVSVGAIQTQTKSATPTTSAQTITPDSGKYLSSVSVGAIQTQEKTADVYQSGSTVKTIIPDAGKLLSKVTIPKAFNGIKYILETTTFTTNPINISNLPIGWYLFVFPAGTSAGAQINGTNVTIETTEDIVTANNGTTRAHVALVSVNTSTNSITITNVGSGRKGEYLYLKLADL